MSHVNTADWPHSVSINPNLKLEVARWASASECLRVDCGRTGGHSFCHTERDWWSGLERWSGVFSYSNGRDRDSWTLYIGLCVCMCAYLCSPVYVPIYMEMHCVAPETTEDMKQWGDGNDVERQFKILRIVFDNGNSLKNLLCFKVFRSCNSCVFWKISSFKLYFVRVRFQKKKITNLT